MKRKLLKVGLALLGVACGAVLALYLIGGRPYTYRADIEIDADPNLVFTYLTDEELLLQWMGGVTKIEPLTEGGHRVGAKARITIEENGSVTVMEDEVVDSKPGSLLQVKLTNDMITALSVYDLHSHGSRTHLSHHLITRYKNWVRVFAPLAGGAVTRKLNDDLTSLKQLIESRPDDAMLDRIATEEDEKKEGASSDEN